MNQELRVAIITGAAQGIGKRTAELFAERGYCLALSDLRQPVDTLRAVRERGAEALEFIGDISEEAVVASFATQVRAQWGRADVLVNNAGISFIAPAESLSGADYRRVLDVNLENQRRAGRLHPPPQTVGVAASLQNHRGTV